MYSVTRRIKNVKQPYGGYLRPRDFHKHQLINEEELLEYEDGNPSLIGLTVDYLTRYSLTKNVHEVFKIAALGAKKVGEIDTCIDLLDKVNGLDKTSIENAYKLSAFDSVFRAGPATYKPINSISIDENTIKNIGIMVNRSLSFIKQYGPIVKSGFTFEGGYTSIVSSGDGDFLTNDTLWEFKVISSSPKKEHTLQLIMYYLMGKKSIHKEFDNISKIGIYNPRFNIAYTYEISNMPKETLEIISSEVIGYL